MSSRHTVIRTLHDVGLAAWFGGGLMGTIGLNGAAATASGGNERLRISSVGWARWLPVQLVAMIAHGIGGIGLIIANRGRLVTHSGTRSNTVVKTVLTLAAILATGWSGLVGARMAKAASEGESATGTTEPDSGSSEGLATAQKQQKVLQWAIPAITAVLIALAAQQGEQQHESSLRHLFR